MFCLWVFGCQGEGRAHEKAKRVGAAEAVLKRLVSVSPVKTRLRKDKKKCIDAPAPLLKQEQVDRTKETKILTRLFTWCVDVSLPSAVVQLEGG